jgi:hypothetical protein
MNSPADKKLIKYFLIPSLVILTVGVGYVIFQSRQGSVYRTRKVIQWIRNPQNHSEWSTPALSRCFPSTPFLFPTEGFIGYLWDDSFRPGHRHQGIDIFSNSRPGETPVYAAYDGYLTRLPEWQSSLIIRVPNDPLAPGRQIWIYYTHLADESGKSYIETNFPPGTQDVFVEEGTLLAYQGNYSGSPGNPVGVHLHFSIVLDDENGSFKNELKFQNTLDPSPYFDLNLNGKNNQRSIVQCITHLEN